MKQNSVKNDKKSVKNHSMNFGSAKQLFFTLYSEYQMQV